MARTSLLFFVTLVAIATLARADERFSYDSAGRLTRAVYADGSSITYGYDANGNILAMTFAGPSRVAQPSAPASPVLLAVAPNPAQSEAVMRYVMPAGGDARLEVHDMLGRVVRIVTSGAASAGAHTASLDVHALPPGMYSCGLTTRAGSAHAMLVVMR